MNIIKNVVKIKTFNILNSGHSYELHLCQDNEEFRILYIFFVPPEHP